MQQDLELPSKHARLKRMLVILLPILAIMAGASYWLQATYGTADMDVPDPPPPFAKYADFQPPTESSLTTEVTSLLDRLALECADIEGDVSRTDQALRDNDPHLNKAIESPYETDFMGPKSRSLSEIFEKCEPILQGMVDEFMASDAYDPSINKAIEPVLRRVLLTVVSRKTVDSKDIETLQKFYDEGMTDPLVLACIVRTIDASYTKTAQLAEALFDSRATRPLNAPSAAFVMATFPMVRTSTKAEQYAEITSEGIKLWADIWQEIEKYKEVPDYELFLFTEMFNYSLFINHQGNIDLLFEMEKRKNPSVPSELVHFFAYRVLHEIGMKYRGSDFISDVPESDLQKFGEYARRATVHLSKAWSLAPQHNVLSAQLMDLEMRAGTTGLSTDHWFRHSLAAAVDSKLAFQVFATTTQSRWGGHGDIQLWFVEKCIRCDPNRSAIFFKFATTFNTYLSEQNFQSDLGHDPALRKIALHVVDELRKYSPDKMHDEVKPGTLTGVTGVLWQAQEFEALNWLLSVYGDVVCCENLHVFRIHTLEAKQFVKKLVSSESPSWRKIHSLLHSDSRKLTIENLDTLDIALIEAEKDADDEALLKLVNGYKRRASMLRRFLSGEELILAKEDLENCFEYNNGGAKLTFTTVMTEPKAPASETEASDGTQQSQIPDTDVGANDAVAPSDALAREVGCVDIVGSCFYFNSRLALPFLVSPPFQFSADVSVLDEKNAAGDPYGVSLLVGPCGADVKALDTRGPMFTVLPNFSGVIRDYLPSPAWLPGSPDYRTAKSDAQFTKCNLRLDVYSDGFRSYFEGDRWEEISIPIDNAGWLQFGRYSNAYYNGVGRNEIGYRISNIRLQRLQQATLNVADENDSSAEDVPSQDVDL